MELLKLLVHEDNEFLLVDHDRITLSNLHRLFMFTKDDQGRYKSERAAEIINSRYRSTARFLSQRVETVPVEMLSQYDVIVGALDNVESRMNLNLVFKQSSCRLLIDCGVDGYRAHAKVVDKDTSCLYCIRDLYRDRDMLNMCSLASVPQSITHENRGKVLRTLVELERDRPGDRTCRMRRIVDRFNALVESDDMKTDLFDVAGMYDNVLPNVCFINSICAGLVFSLLADESRTFDFVFYSGEEGISFTRLTMERDMGCIVCGTDIQDTPSV